MSIGGGVKLGGGVSIGPKKGKAPAAVAGERVGELAATPLPPEMTALQRAFKDRANAESARHTEAIDSEFWVAICFETREQKEEFLRETALDLLGDKYLDGHEAAEVLGVELTKTGGKRKVGRVDGKLAGLVKR